MRLVILELDKPNKNRRVYPRSVIEKALLRLPARLLIQRTVEDEGVPLLANTVGEANLLRIEGDQVTAECNFMGGDWSDQVAKGILHVVPSGEGSLSKANEGGFCRVQDDYSFVYLFLTTDPS